MRGDGTGAGAHRRTPSGLAGALRRAPCPPWPRLRETRELAEMTPDLYFNVGLLH